MLKLQLDLCVMSALVLILLGRTMPSSPQVTAQIDKDYHINEMVLVRSRSELDNGEFGMLFGLTCPTFLHGRCPPCPVAVQGLVPGYVLKKKKEGRGGKREMVCRLVRIQENSSKSNSLGKESIGGKGVSGIRQKKVKRELERDGKVMKWNKGWEERKRGDGGAEIELLDLGDQNARDEDNHDVGLMDNNECERSNSPGCRMAALVALFGGESSVGVSDVGKTKRSLSPRNSEQNGNEDLGEIIKEISLEEEKTATTEGSSTKEFPGSPVILKMSPVVAISAVFLVSIAAFVIIASLLIRRLDVASKKVSRFGSRSELEPTKPQKTLLRKQSTYRVQLPSQSDIY